MHFIYIFFISAANNLDNIGVRIAYSIRGIRISLQKNLWISVLTFFISTIAAYLGSTLSGFFNKQISSMLSMLLFIGIGVWIITDNYIRSKKNLKPLNPLEGENSKNLLSIIGKPENADIDDSKEIDFKEATFLGIALSLNNIGGGLSAGMIGLNYFYVGFLSAVISFLALWTGNYLTKLFNRFKLEHKAGIIAGVILILIGVKQIL